MEGKLRPRDQGGKEDSEGPAFHSQPLTDCQAGTLCLQGGDGQTLLRPGPKILLPFVFNSAGHVPIWQSWSHLFMALGP